MALADQKARDQIRKELDKTLVVEAAAGTGKTTELVNRIISVLASGRTTVDRIVAVTFTDKAAGELKLRLRAELEKARAGSGFDDQQKANLEEALAHLEEARAGTIHSFCADLLRERPMEARIDPQFEAIDEGTSEQLYRSAFRTWLEEILEDPPEGVRRSLRRSSDDGPTARLESAGWTLASWRDFDAEWERPAFDRVAAIDQLVNQLHDFADLTRRTSDTNHPVYVATRRARDLSGYITTVEKSRARDYDGLESQLIDLVKAWDFRINKKGLPKYGDGVSRNEVIDSYEELCAVLRAFAATADADLAALLRTELRQSIALYEALKDRTGKLDFLDLLLRARDLLRDNLEVRADLQQRFTHIFVDEFQDTDPLQVEVLLLLASADPTVSNWHEVKVTPGKLFIVGDPKQAIYRFRRADVGLYLDAKEMLVNGGAIPVQLTTSFRSVPFIQNFVNESFAPLMTGDRPTLQAEYVPLSPCRKQPAKQPSIIALSVPEPYGKVRLAAYAVEESLPDATGAFVDWVVKESGWTVTERGSEERVPVKPQHICIMFRRFDKMFGGDMTRGYADALQARGIPHVLVGGKSFHEREEVGTMRTALAALEWPDDTLSVYATLRGSLFALSDAELLSYRAQFGRWQMFQIPDEAPEDLQPVKRALEILRELSRRRNYWPISDTVNELLTLTRAHAGFAMRPAGEQVLANVLHVAELARQYEAKGAVSFRGFVEELLEAAERGKQSEAMIYEEGVEGVRMMSAHRAKGLEFPIVVLADITCKIAHEQPDRYLDPQHNLCAVRLAGWTPQQVIDHAADEHARDLAEGIRLAYVAATRARDVLVVPAIGEDLTGNKGPELSANWWTSPLYPALYPGEEERHHPAPATMCPTFGIDTVLTRPDGSLPYEHTVRPGAHSLGWGAKSYRVVWWDPHKLELGKAPSFSIRQQELLERGSDSVTQRRLADYQKWKDGKEALIAAGSVPTLVFQTATGRAKSDIPTDIDVELIEIAKGPRPFGPRFGALVHATLATVGLGADRDEVSSVAESQGRILGASPDQISAATDTVVVALEHPLMKRAQAASKEGLCYRELPLTLQLPDGLVEGIADLVFLEHGKWSVIDFKTDHELATALSRYRRQVAIYAAAVRERTGAECRVALFRL